MTFEIVRSLRNPGGYACEAIDYESEGEATIVEFFSGDSEQLAREYAEWKNAHQNQFETSKSMYAGSTHF